MKKITRIFMFVFGGIGLALFAVAFYFWQDTQSFLAKAVEAEGVVIKLVGSHYRSGRRSYKPLIEFTTRKGQTIRFTGSVASSPPSHYRGERVTVVYLPNNPQNARIKSFWMLYFLPTLLGGIGAVFFSVGFGFFFAGFFKKRRVQYLRQHGMPVLTEFQGVSQNTSVRVNGRHPFQIMSQWQDPRTSNIHIFKSDDIWYDPTEFVPPEISVWVKPNNPRVYHMDLSFLPKQE